MTTKRVFMFPGQGSQAVGMGLDLVQASPTAQKLFEEMDAALGFNLSKIIFEGPLEDLTLTANVQPALLATSIAFLRVTEEKMGRSVAQLADAVLGHSLGEYTALVANGALDFSDAIRLVHARGQAMQASTAGIEAGMSVILNLPFEALQTICEQASALGVCEIANDNAPGQIVIAGVKAAVMKANELALAAGAKRAMMLPLSTAPHCSLMQPAAEKMKDLLEKTSFKTPSIPLLSNRTCALTTDRGTIKDDLLFQMTHGVRFRECALALAPLGFTDAIEFGAGAILSGLVSKSVPTLKTQSVNSPASLDAFVDSLKN